MDEISNAGLRIEQDTHFGLSFATSNTCRTDTASFRRLGWFGTHVLDCLIVAVEDQWLQMPVPIPVFFFLVQPRG